MSLIINDLHSVKNQNYSFRIKSNKMLRQIEYIRHLGVKPNYSDARKRSIILLNEVLLLLFFSHLVMYPLVFESTASNIFFYYLPGQIGLLLLFLINYFKLSTVAKTIITIIVPTLAFILSLFNYFNFDITLLFTFNLIFIVLFFQKNWIRLLLILYTAFIAFFLTYYRTFFDTSILIPNQAGLALNLFITVFVHLVIVFFIARYSAVSKQIQNQLKEGLDKIKSNNDVLKTNKQEIQFQQEQLKRANTELERFAYIASHDLKSPLRNITSFMNLIQRKLKDYPDESIHEYLGFATSSAKQMHFLVNDILEYSRLGNNKIELHDVNLNETMTTIQQRIQSSIEAHQAVIKVEKLPIIRANDTQMLLLFQNLIENGIKYNKSKQPVIEVKSAQKDNQLIISVSDNGDGIPSEFKEKVFEMFQRLHSQEEAQGSGIGLAICKKIVEQHGGKLWFESQEEVGTTFFVEISSKAILNEEFRIT